MSINPRPFDVVVLGGGPAGASTALSLKRTRPELSVALVEAGDFDFPRVGETLPPSATPLLRQLGVLEKVDGDGHLSVFSTSAAWGSDLPVPNEYFSQTHSRGWHLDRNRFDQTLLHAAQAAGADWLRARLSRTRLLANGHWSLDLADTRERLQARFVVDATGRRAVFARQQGVKPVGQDRLVGAARFFCASADIDDAQWRSAGTLIESCTEGWWYSAVLPDRRLVVVAMTDADIARRLELHKAAAWSQWIAATRYTRQRLQAHVDLRESLGAPLMRCAATRTLQRYIGENWLAVGDAASSVDPVSSQGITRALRFGIYASYAICDWFANKKPGLAQYQAMALADFQDFLVRRREVYRAEQRWAQQPFWARRH